MKWANYAVLVRETDNSYLGPREYTIYIRGVSKSHVRYKAQEILANVVDATPEILSITKEAK